MEANGMSLREFWANVRLGAGLDSTRATVDAPRLDEKKIEQILRRAHLWLTPNVVEGFDISDFDFLSDQERQTLSESVDRFRQVVEQVPADAVPSTEQVQEALPHFRRIVELLRPDRYANPDAFIIGKRIEQLVRGQVPEWFKEKEMVFETGNDANGDPALWIWVEIDDTAADETVFSQNTRAVRNTLEMAVRKLGIDRWPYIRFRTVSEQRALSR
jgi:hypothetical protein